MGYLSKAEIAGMGFSSVGENAQLSSNASFYNCAKIDIASNVRIDDFCVLSAGPGGIEIGNYVHIAVYASLIGAANITLEDYCNISSRVGIYSSSDDYSGMAMTNPTIPSRFTNVHSADIKIMKHVIIGSNSVVLPGLTLGEGAAIGAMSLVKSDCEQFGIFAGIPANRIGDRKRSLLELEEQFEKSDWS